MKKTNEVGFERETERETLDTRHHHSQQKRKKETRPSEMGVKKKKLFVLHLPFLDRFWDRNGGI